MLDALPLERLRERSSTKWASYPADVLPLFVAETDFPLAPPIQDVLARAVARGDTGYVPSHTDYPAAYADFAERRFGWRVDPERVRTTCDVMMAMAEVLRQVTEPGDRVIVTPPIYPPFFAVHEESGTEPVSVPLLKESGGWTLDLDGIEAAFADGARAILLCNPHNPTGTVHAASVLTELAERAARFGAWVISDEIHAPLTMTGATFTPFLSVSEVAAEVGFSLSSASKAFNLAGLKCAHIVTSGDAPSRVVRRIPMEVEWRTGLFGILAGIAAFRHGDSWLDALLARLEDNRRVLSEALDEYVPGAVYHPGDAGFLGWIDLRALDWGDDPARRILDEARVALNPGRAFGDEGRGHVRLNYGTSPEIVQEAVRRIGALVTA